MASFTDIVVIVTGGSTGSGRELSRALAGRGYAVVVVYLDDQRGAEVTVDEIIGADGTAIAVRADTTDELDVERLFSETVASFGGVDVVVHADRLATRVVDQQAAGQLRDGGIIVTAGGSEVVAPFLINKLHARGIRIAGPSPGLEPGCRLDTNYCLSILDSWRCRSAGRQGD